MTFFFCFYAAFVMNKTLLKKQQKIQLGVENFTIVEYTILGVNFINYL